jgi:transcriptional regulator with XRE-family HTH domain
MSDAAVRSLRDLGSRLREARLRRNWTQAQTAAKAGLSEGSIKKVEAGTARITVAAYLALLDVFGLPTAFDKVMAPGDDQLGEALGRNALRQRAGTPRATATEEDDWEI